MTDEQINAAIHAALGNPIGCPRCADPQCAFNKGLNYCADLSAMHEAEKVFNKDEFMIYCDLLWPLGHGVWEAIHATARQRAEAFLRTLGKWQEATDKDSLTVQPTTEDCSVDHFRDVKKMIQPGTKNE